ncbi:hypothetical protein KS4_32840 [Poriferisphaera corsica]|uniref:Uncharacterized protein n=1 Tax=Poriferisphaera corsica TaxID=2528020 RepID=A0A517YYA4_9BACT|nr:hypothetical protein [Poriferisphaera corsica]QDU35204.1 hypothetical protein KS4_32840 [Poriferisphaera corsica]
MTRSLRYLNGVLTVIAVLLTLNLWAMWQSTPGGEVMSLASKAEAQGIANSGAQRKMIIDELKILNSKAAGITGLLQSGKVVVELRNPEFKKKQ